MRYPITIPVLVLGLSALAACSSETDAPEESGEHVWKGQVEAIDKAREVETILKRNQNQENQ